MVHTHPIELVAMTHNPEFLGKDVLTRLLWSMIPETRAFCPKGLGIVPYTLPGSQELADRTIALLDDYDVVMWTKHGALAIGTDLIEAFDQIDLLSKSAKIYESARSMGFGPTGMSDAEMQERCPHNTPGEPCPADCHYAACHRPTHEVCDDFELLLNPDLGYDAAVKEVCHFCTFFLTHGPSIEECPRQEHKLGARNRFIL